MQDIKKRFAQIDRIESFQRVDDQHVLDLYLGVDNMSRYTLVLISQIEPSPTISSQIISVQIGVRRDNKWAISFSLVDNKYEDIFCHFCIDIIESSRTIVTVNKGAEFICLRYTKWQNMLAKFNSGLLPKSAIKGLIGELYFLKDYLIPLYGQEIAVNSWIGPEKADQDFVCGNTWYEVKSTVSGAESIKISSIEQLDMPMEGELVIVYLDKTSCTDEFRITVNQMFQDIYDSLDTEELKQKFSDILLNLGYYKTTEYDEYMYRYAKMERYKVDLNFPCIRRNILPQAVISSSYYLSISSINNLLKE